MIENRKFKVLAIIPARGGSKGVPRKNIIDVAGHPLIAWTIMEAQKSEYINKIIVTTDDIEISMVAQSYGSEVVIRPSEISGDKSSSEQALLHALEYLKINQCYFPDLVVFLQCTSPLTSSQDIDLALEQLLNHQADVVFSATPTHAFLWRINADGVAVGVNHNCLHRPMRQEIGREYKETGAFYVIRTEGLIEYKHRFFGKVMIYEVPPERSLDIDEQWEFLVTETLLKNQKIDLT